MNPSHVSRTLLNIAVGTSSPSEKSGCRGVEGMMGRASNQWSRR